MQYSHQCYLTYRISESQCKPHQEQNQEPPPAELPLLSHDAEPLQQAWHPQAWYYGMRQRASGWLALWQSLRYVSIWFMQKSTCNRLIYRWIINDFHNYFIWLVQTVCAGKPYKSASAFLVHNQHNKGLPPLFWRGWRRRRQENFGILRSKLDGLLSKIDDSLS